MSQSIYFLLEIPVDHGLHLPGKPGSHVHWPTLLARSKIRVIPADAADTARPVPIVMSAQPPLRHDADEGAPVRSLEEVERDYIVEILARSGGNRSKAARLLNISRRTLQRKMAQFLGAGRYGQ